MLSAAQTVEGFLFWRCAAARLLSITLLRFTLANTTLDLLFQAKARHAPPLLPHRLTKTFALKMKTFLRVSLITSLTVALVGGTIWTLIAKRNPPRRCGFFLFATFHLRFPSLDPRFATLRCLCPAYSAFSPAFLSYQIRFKQP
jgi:hypothetical protein